MQIYPRNSLPVRGRQSQESESTLADVYPISLEPSKAKLFRVHSNGSPPASSNDWFDVETQKHEQKT